MKRTLHHLLPAVLLLALAATSCIVDPETYYVRGTLYTDSTLATPWADTVLTFYLVREGFYYEGVPQGMVPCGTATTDRQGRFGFAYNEVASTRSTKFQFDELMLDIALGDELLYSHVYNRIGDTLTLYPGCRRQHQGRREP